MIYHKFCKVCGKPFATHNHAQMCCSKSCGVLSRKKLSICWDCKNYHCNWLKNAKPVEGWEAIERPYKIKNGRTDKTYRVTKCPEYIE